MTLLNQVRRHGLIPLTCSLVIFLSGCTRSNVQDATQVHAPAVLPVLSPSPGWQVTTLDGKAAGSEQLKGKVVVVDFWATWCGPCVHEIPGYIAMQKKYADRGLVIVGLSVDQNGLPVVSKFVSERGVNYSIALATQEIITAFGGIDAIPTTFLIDREGRIRHKKTGAMESDEYEKLIVTLL